MSDKSDLPALLALIDEALDLSPTDRSERFAKLRRVEPARASRLEAMVFREERLNLQGFLKVPPEVPSMPAYPLADTQLGGYTLERPLGRGGMGTVWMARRSDGRYDGVAAVKLLHLALLDTTGGARFRREGTALARLSHPRIARLLDAGVNATGQPYLVLEYVEGERIDTYCDARRLSPEARLQLFLQVLDGVAHAHASLIVHRDLKPSNILVTPDGGVKLLDFGIAKLLGDDADATEATLTHPGAWALTPEYAAPEQVTGGAVTTATDVYALGVMLYQLLTGRHPTGEGSRTPTDHLAGILETEAPRASVAVAPEAAVMRGASPDRLRRLYDGDLDTILAKALRKDPASRYASVSAFADDLKRFLEHQPISARPDSLWYRSGKFIRRHRVGVLVAGVIALLLMASGWRERSLRHRAEIEARTAQEVGDYLVSVFAVGDPFAVERRNGTDITARALLDQGVRRLDSSLAGQPELQAKLRSVLGRAYTSLGYYEQGTLLLRQALAQHLALHGRYNLTVAENEERLGDALLQQDRFGEAEPLLIEALALRRRLGGSSTEATAQTLDRLAMLHQRRDEYAAAEPLFREALAIRRRLFGDASIEVARSLNNIGALLHQRGAHDEAERTYREALAINARQLGERHPRTAQTRQNLAQTQQSLGDDAAAEELYRRALAARRNALGDAHPDVTVNLNSLASVLIAQGRLDEAEVLILEALVLDRQIFGENHSSVAADLRSLGRVLRFKGRLAESALCFRKALAISRTVFGSDHHTVALDLNYLGVISALRNDQPAAVQSFREAVETARRLLGDDHISTIAYSINLGRALQAMGDASGAEPMLRSASRALDTTNAAHRAWHVNAESGLGLALVAQGRAAEALAGLERAVDFARRHLGEEHVRTADAQLALGRALLDDGRPRAAEPLLQSAASVFEKRDREEPVLAAQAAAALAELQRMRARDRHPVEG